ncbi:MAG: pyridoxamine 5'-phosphate oxidase [Bacteroidetes bacterium]|nr:pyridoxamine 5'-phosphate oxidase [Bacteroidota bacterium]
MSIADIRKEYAMHALSEADVQANPLQQFSIWWNEALQAEIEEVNAVTLATASADGLPTARTVLLKGYDERGFVFYTNYNSQKAAQLEENPRATLLFFWKELERQVRITGLVEKTSAEESDAYYHSRPEGSRLGAWASPQSSTIESREWLENKVSEMEKAFTNGNLNRPPHWGGYRVKPVIVEFWQGRPSRLHDRIQYSIQTGGNWKIERLAP